MKEISIVVSDELCQMIEEMGKEAGFTSMPEYIIYILEKNSGMEKKNQEISFSPEDEEKVVDRLKSLGYID